MSLKRKRATNKNSTSGGGTSYGVSKKRATKSKSVGYNSVRGIRSRTIPEQQYLFCMKLIDDFLNRQECFSFSKPVLELWSIEVVPTYKEVIKHPMDLGTIKGNLISKVYGMKTNFKPELFAKHVRLVFQNCRVYNAPDSDLYILATKLLAQFENRFNHLPIDKKIPDPSSEIDPEEEFDKRSTPTIDADSDTRSELDHLVQPKNVLHSDNYDDDDSELHDFLTSRGRGRGRSNWNKKITKSKPKSKQNRKSTVEEKIIDKVSVLSQEKETETESERGGSKIELENRDDEETGDSEDESNDSNDDRKSNESEEEQDDDDGDEEGDEDTVKSTRSESPDGVWSLPSGRQPAAERSRLTRRLSRQLEVVKKAEDEAKKLRCDTFKKEDMLMLKEEIEHSDWPIQRKAASILENDIERVLGIDWKKKDNTDFVSIELGIVDHEYLRQLEELVMPRTQRGRCLARAKQFHEASKRTQARIDAFTRGGRKKQARNWHRSK